MDDLGVPPFSETPICGNIWVEFMGTSYIIHNNPAEFNPEEHKHVFFSSINSKNLHPEKQIESSTLAADKYILNKSK